MKKLLTLIVMLMLISTAIFAQPPFPSVTICSQTWMQTNLDVAFYRNGDPIPQATSLAGWTALTSGAWCYYAFNSSNGTTYGKLYNWYAVNDPRGLAPEGWHVPTLAEWNTLVTTCLGGRLVAGGKMKETGTTLWLSPNAGATNSSGWTGLPGGSVYNGGFYDIRGGGYWWTATEEDGTRAYARDLDYDDANVDEYFLPKHYGFSVRCIADPCTTPNINCPSDTTVNNDAGWCGAIVSFAATATGNPAPIITYSPASGSLFPIGTTTVTATATNDCGTASCTFTVTVNPLAPPTNVTATASAICIGGTSNLNATAAGAAIKWYTVPTDGTAIGTSASGADFSVSPVATTTYYAESDINTNVTRTYPIPLAQLINLPVSCGNGGYWGGGNVGFSWNDIGAGVVTSLQIQIGQGVDCNTAGTPHPYTLNGSAAGSYNTTSYFCNCSRIDNIITINPSTSGYIVGGTNTLLISSLPSTVFGFTNPAILGFYYARVTVITSLVGSCSSATRIPVTVTVNQVPIINAPTVTQPNCASATGTIVVNATGTGTLEYSIDNGANWQAGATFGGLAAGSYTLKVRVQATPACEAAYSGNPVIINSATLALACPADIVTPNAPGICGKTVTYSLPNIINDCNPCISPTAIPNYTYLGEFGGHRYFRSNFSRTWNQAKTMAEGLGAHLVTLSSEAESNHVKGNGQMAWIGLTDEAVEGTFAWVTGEPVTYTNWWPGDPNNNGGDEDYVLMNFYGSTKWVDEGTNYFHRFIIEFDCGGVTQTAGLPSGTVFPVGVTTNSFSYTDASNNTTTCSFTVTVNDTEPPTLTCPANVVTPATSPSGAVVNFNSPVVTDNCYTCITPTSLPNYTYLGTMNGHTYFRSNFSRTWPQANALATGLGGHLVTLSSATESELVKGNGQMAWIGFTDEAVENTFVWVTGEPVTYTNWWPGEPNNGGGDEDYVLMNFYGSSKWVDAGTNYFYPFIVEFECNPLLTQTAGFPSGSEFPPGITTNSFTYMDAGGNPASCSFTVEVTPVPPLPNPITKTDIEKTVEVRTYPNPSAGEFNLLVISESSEPITVRILDETGNIKKVMQAISNTKTIRVGAGLPAGKYVAEVIQGNSIQTVKLVKIN